MTLQEISQLRLINQKIAASKFKSPQEIVSWMGAMQAQDFQMAKWAVGLRLLNATNETIEDAYNRGTVLRTHLMRPTWHFVSADDIHWILELTAPKIKASINSRHRDLGLTSAVLSKSNNLVRNALTETKSLTREELDGHFQKAGIKTDQNRLSHLMLWAELSGIACSGPVIDKKLSYALLSGHVPQKKTLTRDESLAELAKRYFVSHGPATLQDFVWWSGLSAGDARKALEFVKTGIDSEIIGSETYWFSTTTSLKQKDASVYLLPAYDEFLISYSSKNRHLSLPRENNHKTVSSNGIFRPLIVEKGQVIGLWKRVFKNEKVVIETELFKPATKALKSQIIFAAEQYAQFLGKKPELYF